LDVHRFDLSQKPRYGENEYDPSIALIEPILAEIYRTVSTSEDTLPDHDPKAKNAMRYPKVIEEAEIDSLPRLEFNTGIDTAIFISRERDDARYFRHGYCYMEPDHGDYHWDQSNFDESHFCLEGRIKLRVEDAAGKQIVLEAKEGEHIFLPAGYKYTLEATGVKSKFFWTSGPSPRVGLADAKEYSEKLTALRGE
jgi:ethanolamine utilization protein EutQ (cupin superfamily)